MPLPAIIAGALAGVAARYVGGRIFGRRGVRRRRRRQRLTAAELQELITIKNTLGRTAAANMLPFYMGRG